jgi:hypothetical protein
MITFVAIYPLQEAKFAVLAVIVMNVLSYYNPLRELVRNGVEEGFISERNEKLILFVNGPEDHVEHEDYDWGKSALEALNGWQAEHIEIYYDWTKRKGQDDTNDGSHMGAA